MHFLHLMNRVPMSQ